MSLTVAVREELASVEPADRDTARAELSGMLRFSGVLHRHGGPGEAWTWVATVPATAARRADRTLTRLYGHRVELRARRATAPRPVLVVEMTLPPVLLAPLALERATERGGGGLPPWLDDDPIRWAYVRGAALVGLRLSNPHRPHCEVAAPSRRLAVELTDLLGHLGVAASAAAHTRDRWRVVLKSRAAIGTLLAGTGATAAYLSWEDERARHAVRGAATRGANADRANAERSVRAAAEQVATAVEALARVEVDALDDDLRTTALARLANPTASLAELATLLEVSRATVSRRFQRLAAVVAADDDSANATA